MSDNDEKKNDGNNDITQKLSRSAFADMKTIPVICPWCKTIFKLSKWQIEENKKSGVTHGICDECLKKMGYKK